MYIRFREMRHGSKSLFQNDINHSILIDYLRYKSMNMEE